MSATETSNSGEGSIDYGELFPPRHSLVRTKLDELSYDADVMIPRFRQTWGSDWPEGTEARVRAAIDAQRTVLYMFPAGHLSEDEQAAIQTLDRTFHDWFYTQVSGVEQPHRVMNPTDLEDANG